jgi:hypothetical protein
MDKHKSHIFINQHFDSLAFSKYNFCWCLKTKLGHIYPRIYTYYCHFYSESNLET